MRNNILLIEENAEIGKNISALLQREGYDVFLALFKTIFYHKIPFIYFLGDAKLKTARVLSVENCQGERVLDSDLVQCVKKCMAVELPLMDSATVTAMSSVGAQWP